MEKSRYVFTVFLVFLLALIPLQTVFAASDTVALRPQSITSQTGSVLGNLASLSVRDQNWYDDDPAKYVTIIPSAPRYTGYRTYQLPVGVSPSAVTAMRIEVNYQGPIRRQQSWIWSLYNWNTKRWLTIGNNAKAVDWEWGVFIFNIVNPARYISASGKIRLRLISSHARTSARLDYEAIHILYTPVTPPTPVRADIPLPAAGTLYHGVFPGGQTGEEDDLALADLTSYETASGKTAAWTYFSHNWYHGRAFPIETAAWIRDHGSVPYIRLMLRSSAEQNRVEPTYSLARILSGAFDNDLRAWCAGARDFGTPLIAEYGVEVNGEWFPWNGRWNGGGLTTGYGDPRQPNGPERFRNVYRRIIQICRDEGAENITWVFHVNDGDSPDVAWNRFENYYPGDDYIDWLAVSSYGAQTPQDNDGPIFRESMDAVYPRLAALSATKPVIVAEFGITANNPRSQSQWAQAALTDLTTFRWPRIVAFSWWNEWWQNDDNPAHDTDMRVQTHPLLAQIFQTLVGTNPIVIGHVNSREIVPPDRYEADNRSPRARSTANRRIQHRNIHAPGNVDWVKFKIYRNGARGVDLMTRGTAGDTEMWLYGANRAGTAASGRIAYNDDRGANPFARIRLSGLASGTYFIKIQEKGNNGTIRDYTLRTRWISTRPRADAYESDNRASTARTIANGRTQRRTIHAPDNRDWARFTIGGSGARNLVVQTAGTSGDTQLWACDRSGNRLAYDDDSGPGRFSRIVAPFVPPGTYTIRIQEKGNNGTIPAYTLRVTWTQR